MALRGFRALAAAGMLRAVRAIASAGLWRRTAVGIDLGTAAVKVVALSTGRWRGDLRLERCAMEACRPAVQAGAVTHHWRVPLDTGWQQAALGRALARAGIRACEAVLGVPVHAAHSATTVVAASMPAEERRWEAEDLAYRLFPAPAEPCFDVVEHAVGKAGHLELRVVATSSSFASARAGVASGAGLRIAALDLDRFALGRALAAAGHARPDDSRPWMLADLGAGHPTAMLCRGTEPQISLPMPGGTSPELANDASALAMEVGAAMDAFRATSGGPGGPLSAPFPPSHIVLAGGRAAMPGLRQAVASRTGLPTTVADPFAGMALGPAIDQVALAGALPAYLLATGLALRGLL